MFCLNFDEIFYLKSLKKILLTLLGSGRSINHEQSLTGRYLPSVNPVGDRMFPLASVRVLGWLTSHAESGALQSKIKSSNTPDIHR